MKIIKNKKTHLVFPKELLEEIDKAIGKRKRSEFVVNATKEKLAKEKFLKALEKSAGSWKNRENEDVDSYIRDLRQDWHKRLKRIY